MYAYCTSCLYSYATLATEIKIRVPVVAHVQTLIHQYKTCTCNHYGVVGTHSYSLDVVKLTAIIAIVTEIYKGTGCSKYMYMQTSIMCVHCPLWILKVDSYVQIVGYRL